MKNIGSVSIDVDTLASIYKGQGCSRRGGYTFIEFRSGVENMLEFFAKYEIKTTMFMVGDDFTYQKNHAAITEITRQGHEIANHSMTHPQGFRWLSANEKKNELTSMAEICQQVTGKKPVGFRSPGWNIDDSAIPILNNLQYVYDSSVFPTSLMPLMKFAHWASMSRQNKHDRTTMGQLSNMFAPLRPYTISPATFVKKGNNGLIEFPISVTPYLRFPFFATLLLSTGIGFYEKLYRSIKRAGLPLHFQMHLSDFIDYSIPELKDQMPSSNQGTYIPLALQTPIKKKLSVFRELIDMVIPDYDFITLESWAKKIGSEK